MTEIVNTPFFAFCGIATMLFGRLGFIGFVAGAIVLEIYSK